MGAMTRKEKVLWYVGALVIVLYAVVPVAYIVSMSFKSEAALSDKQFFPSQWTWANYDGIFRGNGSDLFLRPAELDHHVPRGHAHRRGAVDVRRLRHRAAELPRQARGAHERPGRGGVSPSSRW